MNPVSLSVIIPAYNEAGRLPSYLASIVEYLDRQDISYEVIVVDDGSTDATADSISQLLAAHGSVKMLPLPANRGKGFAVKTGMLQASGKLRLFTDADGATPISELARLRKAVDAGAEVAIASRAMKDASCTVAAHLHRKVIGGVFNFLVNKIAVKGIHDTQCGFKLFTEKAARTVFPLQRIHDFGFDVEILLLCRKNGLRIAEVPVNWSDVAGSKVHLIRDSWRMLTDIFQTRLNNFRGMYQVK